MKPKKLKLDEVEVKSFLTTEGQKKISGGDSTCATCGKACEPQMK